MVFKDLWASMLGAGIILGGAIGLVKGLYDNASYKTQETLWTLASNTIVGTGLGAITGLGLSLAFSLTPAGAAYGTLISVGALLGMGVGYTMGLIEDHKRNKGYS